MIKLSIPSSKEKSNRGRKQKDEKRPAWQGVDLDQMENFTTTDGFLNKQNEQEVFGDNDKLAK